METIDKGKCIKRLGLSCQFISKGSHALHAGSKHFGDMPYPKRKIPIREVRTVYECSRCGAIRVKISRHLAYGCSKVRS